MTPHYEKWKAFYEGHITDWMTTDELRLCVGGLLGTYPDSTEVLLIHAMHRVEELEEQAKVDKQWADLWDFVVREAPLQFEEIVCDYPSPHWLRMATELMNEKRGAVK